MALTGRDMTDRGALSILVADDQVELVELVAGWLRRAGHQVVGVTSGRQAATVLASRSVDVVVTDVLMPDGDGIELLGSLRQRAPRPRLIAISGGGRYIESKDCLEIARGCGAEIALRKPFTSAQLLAAVQGRELAQED